MGKPDKAKSKLLSMLPFKALINSNVFGEEESEGGKLYVDLYVQRGLHFCVHNPTPRRVRQQYKKYINRFGSKAWDEK